VRRIAAFSRRSPSVLSYQQQMLAQYASREFATQFVIMVSAPRRASTMTGAPRQTDRKS
jgi:hypothetical protein